MSVIPGGCTKYLQPLDVCINKPFNATGYTRVNLITLQAVESKHLVMNSKSSRLFRRGRTFQKML